MGLADIFFDVVGCHLTQDVRLQMRVGDVAGKGLADIARHVKA
jgi:hypothetical protein